MTTPIALGLGTTTHAYHCEADKEGRRGASPASGAAGAGPGSPFTHAGSRPSGS